MIEKNKTPAYAGRAYLIGICGTGMSALAILLKEAGYKVSGSDEGFYEPILSYLKKNKVNFFKKYSIKNIPKNVDMIVIGKHAGLVPEMNTEVKQAFVLQKKGVKVQSLPEALAQIAKEKENIIVAGSYGKSTCSALLSYCLMQNKKDPSYFIGAVPIDFPQSSRLGNGPDFILEGDEYPSANWDNTSKFLHFNPSSVLLISGEHDHINVFPTEASYTEPYKKLVAKIPTNGLLVYSLEGKNNKEIKKYTKARSVSYALNNKKPARHGGADYYAENIKYDLQTSFDLMHNGEKIINIKTKLLGNHNIENIIGVGAILLENKTLTPTQYAKAVKNFQGIKRRIELISGSSEIPVYEGFGSSYEKTKVIFDALALHFPKKRIVAVFEPHTFSWRNRGALKWYQDIFTGVSDVILLPPPTHGKNTHDQLTFDEIYNEIKKHVSVQKANTEKEALIIIKKIVKNPAHPHSISGAGEGDLIALISSGSLLGLSKSIPKLLKQK